MKNLNYLSAGEISASTVVLVSSYFLFGWWGVALSGALMLKFNCSLQKIAFLQESNYSLNLNLYTFIKSMIHHNNERLKQEELRKSRNLFPTIDEALEKLEQEEYENLDTENKDENKDKKV